jgi:acetyl esterase/lipase
MQVSSAETGTHLTALERLDPEHLQRTHEARLGFARVRQNLPNFGVYQDFRGVIHVHAEDANHTKGTRVEVLAAAKQAGVRVVFLTDHGGPTPATWNGWHDGVLFIAGEENGGAGRLRFPESTSTHGAPDPEQRFLSHIEERYDASTDGLDGMEICNRHTDAVLDRSTEEFLRHAATDLAAWRKLVQSFQLFPDEVFAAGTDYHPRIFQKWDEETAKKPFTGIGANDSHQNQIFQGTTFDPYEVSFRNLSTHIMALELTEHDVRQALDDGHAYVAHDWLCDPTGFAFGAVNGLGVFPMGDSALLVGNTRVVGTTPIPARLKIIHRGQVLLENSGTNISLSVNAAGAYRLEAWLTVDGEERPWIYSNPVYLKAPTLADLELPSMDLSPGVERKKDITYTTGELADEPKHKLDLYLPEHRESAPVFFFIHGGAWRSGDRALYVPVGNQFAKEGIVTVVPSYRLAPKHPFPAQIDDVAAAFAWTVQHLAEYGCSTNRIYVGGHSAGAHLAALLALNPKHLRTYNLAPSLIRGTIALSGVYDLTVGERLASVFGHDPDQRRAASPVTYVKADAPPFLVTYCQWDYPTLPFQAREFHTALVHAGASSRLVYVPNESHISEMVHIIRDQDPTALAIRDFIREK